MQVGLFFRNLTIQYQFFSVNNNYSNNNNNNNIFR